MPISGETRKDSPSPVRTVSGGIRKITDIFAEKERTFSFEFFPPKNEPALQRLYRTADALSELNPDFFSVT